jgi:hypothetical protein
MVVALMAPYPDDAVHAAPGSPAPLRQSTMWDHLIDQAEAAGLPTKFLRRIPPDYVTMEFDDLHAYAAEYHPEDHRLVLNQTLSFNAAGGSLKPLSSLAPREIGTLYHELFHAYMDVISSNPGTPEGEGRHLADFADDRRQCRYQHVTSTPILQRKTSTEARFLTDHEAWEALNETWAVFIGWAIWTTVELQRDAPKRRLQDTVISRPFVKRLAKADREGDLIGYYEPEQEEERAIARKRYLAPSHRITPPEVRILLADVLEFTRIDAERAARSMDQRRTVLPGSPACRLEQGPGAVR